MPQQHASTHSSVCGQQPGDRVAAVWQPVMPEATELRCSAEHIEQRIAMQVLQWHNQILPMQQVMLFSTACSLCLNC